MSSTKNNKALAIAIYLIAIVLYSILVFLYADTSHTNVWMGYGFSMLAFILQAGMIFMAFGKPETKLRDVFFGLPVAIVGVIYLLVQLLAGVFFMLFPGISLKFAATIQILLLAAYLILAISAFIGKNIVVDIDEMTRKKVLFVRSLEITLVELKGIAKSETLKSRLADLAETVRYSDPMSHESLAGLEQRISAMISALAERGKGPGRRTCGIAVRRDRSCSG